MKLLLHGEFFYFQDIVIDFTKFFQNKLINPYNITERQLVKNKDI